MTTDGNQLVTIGFIAQKVQVPRHRVEYFIQSRGIREIARAGMARVFDLSAIERVRVWAMDDHVGPRCRL